MAEKYLTPKEIASILQISYDRAIEFVKTSGVPYVMIGRQYRVSERRLEEFLNPPKVEKISLTKKKKKIIQKG